MEGTIDIKVEVQCKECGDYLTVNDVGNYRSAELCIEVEPCQSCIESAQKETEES